MLQLYLTPGKRLPSSAVFIVGPGVRTEGEGMSTGSSGWQDRVYPVSPPLVTVGACHEKLRLVVVINVTRNILGGPEATGNKKVDVVYIETIKCYPTITRKQHLLFPLKSAKLTLLTTLYRLGQSCGIAAS